MLWMQNDTYRKIVEKNKLKMHLLAEEIKEATHDIGHQPFSHVIELYVIGIREFHEKIGRRILLEDPQIDKIVSKIPGLKQAIEEVLYNNILNNKEHDEGNIDVDRKDYMSRDHFYKGIPKDYSYPMYERIFACIDENGNIQRDNSGNIIFADENTPLEKIKIIDVYQYEDLEKVEQFLKDRMKVYRKAHDSELVQTVDSLVGVFFNLMLKDHEPQSTELINYFKMIKTQDVNSLDLEYLKSFDEVKLYNIILDVAENSKNQYMRELAIMLIPRLSIFMDMISDRVLAQSDGTNNKKIYTQEEKMLIKKLRRLAVEKSESAKRIRNGKTFIENTIMVGGEQKIYEAKSKYPEAFKMSTSMIRGYDKANTIYVKDEFGNIWPLEKHPNRTINWDNAYETINVAFCFIPVLKMNGWTDVQIENLRKNIKPIEYKPVSNTKKSISMQSYKVMPGDSEKEIPENLKTKFYEGIEID